jgi:hypothetical protein
LVTDLLLFVASRWARGRSKKMSFPQPEKWGPDKAVNAITDQTKNEEKTCTNK